MCVCDDGYLTSDCSVYKCFQVRFDDVGVCSGRGVCVSSNVCRCFWGWGDQECKTSYLGYGLVMGAVVAFVGLFLGVFLMLFFGVFVWSRNGSFKSDILYNLKDVKDVEE